MKKLMLWMLALLVFEGFCAGWDPLTRTFDDTGFVKFGTSNAGAFDKHFSDTSYWIWPNPPYASTPATFDVSASYYIPSGIDPVRAISAASQVFACQVLVLGKNAHMSCSTTFNNGKYFTIPNLEMLPDAWLQLNGQACWYKDMEVTVYGYAGHPSELRHIAQSAGESYGWTLENFTLKGDEDAYFMIRGSISDTATNAYAIYRWTSGGAPAYKGTLEVRHGNGNLPLYLRMGDLSIGGSMVVSDRSFLSLTGSSGVTVSNLTFSGNGNLSGMTPSRKFTVTGDFACTGDLVLDFSSTDLGQHSIEAIRFVQGDKVDETILDKVKYDHTSDSWRNEPPRLQVNQDGSKSLVFDMPEVVKRTNAGKFSLEPELDSSDLTSASNGTKAVWSDGLAPTAENAAGKIYYNDQQCLRLCPKDTSGSILNFPARRFVFDYPSGLVNAGGTYGASAGVRFNDFVSLKSSQWQFCNQAGYSDASVKNENGGTIRSFRWQGAFDTGTPSVTNVFYIWNTSVVMVRMESVLRGSGVFDFGSYPSGTPSAIQSAYELTADNSSFKGKITLGGFFLNIDTYGGYRGGAPNRTYFSRLYFSDAASLGGACDDFEFDALMVYRYGKLIPRTSVTLADGLNRGVFFGDYAAVKVLPGDTFAINRPVTLDGQLWKEGAGRLVLGSTVKFGGAAQSATPTTGRNLLTVEAGELGVGGAHALDGVKVTFGEGTRMVVSCLADSTTELAQKGAMNVKGDGAFLSTAADGKIAVLVENPQAAREVAVMTLADAAMETIRDKLRFSTAVRGWRAEFSRVASNGDGTSTLFAAVKFRGMTVSFR